MRHASERTLAAKNSCRATLRGDLITLPWKHACFANRSFACRAGLMLMRFSKRCQCINASACVFADGEPREPIGLFRACTSFLIQVALFAKLLGLFEDCYFARYALLTCFLILVSELPDDCLLPLRNLDWRVAELFLFRSFPEKKKPVISELFRFLKLAFSVGFAHVSSGQQRGENRLVRNFQQAIKAL